MTFDQMANKVTSNVANGPPQFDIAIILMIIEMLQNLIPILQDFCNKDPEDVIKMAKGPSWMERRVVKMEAIKVFGRRGYRQLGNDVCDAVFKTAAESTPQDIAELYQQV